jgi:hypothetical protein
MHIVDFSEQNISCCTPAEVEATGASLSAVNLETILCLDEFCRIAAVEIELLHNGLTSGGHESPEHPLGMAVDFAVRAKPGQRVNVLHHVPMLYWVGYRGVGVYWNGVAYSYHADIGDSFRQWSWERKPDQKGWTKRALILDPADGGAFAHQS